VNSTSPDSSGGGPLVLLIDAVNRRDTGSIDRLLADSVELHDSALEMVLQGRTALHDRLDKMLAAVPDARVEIAGTVETDVQASAETVVTGTHSAPRAANDDSGVAIELPVAAVCALHGGIVTSIRLYYDLATLLQQVGAL
jgi:steroid delta-isomerase-like uncharacterized protein